jgi:hypothetical protein
LYSNMQGSSEQHLYKRRGDFGLIAFKPQQL